MITLKEWMQLVDYRITEGSDWYSNLPQLYSLTYWNEEQDGHSSNIVFDPKNNQRVYAVEICDYKNNRAYRLKDPALESGDPGTDEIAWDDVKFTTLEDDQDFIKKAGAIIAGEDYDTRVSIPIDFSDEELLKYMTTAHEMDITFNQFVENALRAVIEQEKDVINGTNNP